ncbi:MAG: hypothetical protein ABJI00_07920 [Paracoccaceae bacterium]
MAWKARTGARSCEDGLCAAFDAAANEGALHPTRSPEVFFGKKKLTCVCEVAFPEQIGSEWLYDIQRRSQL